ncbi:hypothetical protein SAMN05519103_08487 [Rhizobiales bacterium GAS113]|nr:hypothetical protein SAMN05519103_08487 [Rhizobiales bacterium GAS113]
MISRLPLLFASLGVILLSLAALACETVTPQQVADALSRAPGLNPGLQSCAMAAMAMKESGGGNTCAANSCCVGILQLNIGQGYNSAWSGDRASYQNADLQTQVNGWAATANSNASSQGYRTLNAAYQSGQPINGHTVTAGELAACEQFGAAVCDHNVSSLQAGGTCGSYTDGAGHTGGQTICSWGAAADKQAANQNCTMGNCDISGVGDFPSGPVPQPTNATVTG